MTSPITPSIELVEQWWSEWTKRNDPPCTSHHYIATKAARWGADMELEACCELVPGLTNYLRDARRPKELSLKERALEAVSRLCASVIHDDLKDDAAIVRRALEQLDD